MIRRLLLIGMCMVGLISLSAQTTPITQWKTGDFSTEWVEHTWDFSEYIDDNTREYAVLFRYLSGGCKLMARNAVVKVNGEIVATYSDEVSSSGSDPYSWTWRWRVNATPQTMTVMAEVRTEGDTKSNGNIYLIKDGTLVVDNGETINTSLFKNSTGFHSVVITGNVRKIGNQAFYGCGELERIILDEGVEEIGERTFQLCTNLKNIEIPGHVKTIGRYAFSHIDDLQSVIIEEGVKTIADYAFQQAAPDATIHLPNSVDSIGVGLAKNFTIYCEAGSYAHKYCADNNRSFQKLLFTGITSEYAQTVTDLNLSALDTIRANQFANCPNLRSVTLGLSLKNIGAGAFSGSPIEKVMLYPEVIAIGEKAFHEETIIRTIAGSYAEKWCLANGYVLSGAMSDFHEYTLRSIYERNIASRRDTFELLKQQNPNSQYIIFSELSDIQRILTKDDTQENMKTYSFWTNDMIISKRLSDSEIEITSYLLEPIKNVELSYAANGKNQKIAFFDEIQPLSRIVLKVNGVTEDAFCFSSNDPLFQKVKSIRMHTEIAFILPEAAPADGALGHIPLTPIHAREWIFLITNYANLISSTAYEEMLYSMEGQLFDDAGRTHYLTAEELRQLYTKMMNYPHLNVGIMQGASGMASSKAQTLAIKERALLTFHKRGGALALVMHELSHCLGYKHEDGNMVVAVNEAGERVNVTDAVNFSSTANYTVEVIGDKCWRIYPDYHLLETYNLFWSNYFHFPTAENGVKYPEPMVKYGNSDGRDDIYILEDDIFEDDDFDGDNNNAIIDNRSNDDVTLYTLSRTIVVENATSDICVYDISGRLVACRDKACLVSTVAIPVPVAGIYIVETGGVSQKVLVE